MKSGTVGRQSELHKGAYEALIEAVPQVMIQKFVAGLCGISESQLSSWLSRGRSDLEEDIDSIYAQFLKDYTKARCKVIREKIELIAYNSDLRAGNQWILERCFREHFGKDCEEIRELRALFTQMVLGAKNGQEGQQGQQGKRDSGTVAMCPTNGGQAFNSPGDTSGSNV